MENEIKRIGGRARNNGIIFFSGNMEYVATKKESECHVIRIPFYKVLFILKSMFFLYLWEKYVIKNPQITHNITSYVIHNLGFTGITSISELAVSEQIYTTSVMTLFTLILAIASFVLFETIFRGGRVFQFHSAEHRVLDFYIENGRIPTLAEARQQSSFSTSCGDTIVAVILLTLYTSTVIHSLLPNDQNEYVRTFLYVLGILISFKFFLYLKKNTKLMIFLQIFTLRRPSDEVLEFAISALGSVVD